MRLRATGALARTSFFLTLSILSAAGCSVQSRGHDTARVHHPVRNVILMIGDGMGPQQVALAMLYARYAGERSDELHLNLETLMHRGELGLVQPSALHALVAEPKFYELAIIDTTRVDIKN